MGDQDEPVAGIGLHEVVDGLGDGGGRADEALPARHLDDELAGGQLLGLGLGPPFVGDRDGVAVHAHTGPATRDGVLADDGIDGGQRPVRVVVGQVAVPQLFEELDRGGGRDLRQPDLVRDVGGLGVGVAEDECRGGQDQQLIVAPPVLREPALDVGIERLSLGERSVAREDRVGGACGELAAPV